MIESLIGLTLARIEGMEVGSGEVVLYTTCGRKFRMQHYQDCCEHVELMDVVGDPKDLIGNPIRVASEESNADGPEPEHADSYTWTFYKFATIKGYVDLRWLGESNGYYGEEVTFEEVK